MIQKIALKRDFVQLYRQLRRFIDSGHFKFDSDTDQKIDLVRWVYNAEILAKKVRQVGLAQRLFLNGDFTPSDMLMIYSELVYNRGRMTTIVKGLMKSGDDMLEAHDAKCA